MTLWTSAHFSTSPKISTPSSPVDISWESPSLSNGPVWRHALMINLPILPSLSVKSYRSGTGLPGKLPLS